MRRSRALVAALLLALTLAACGGSEDDEGAGGAGSSTTSESSPGTGPAGEAGGGGEAEEGHDGGEHAHSASTFPASEATQTVKISMRDYAYVDMPATVTGPRLRIEGKNNGPSEHEMVVFDADGNEIGGVKPFESGETKALSIELTAGNYEMRCLIPITGTETHADRGMRVTFAVM